MVDAARAVFREWWSPIAHMIIAGFIGWLAISVNQLSIEQARLSSSGDYLVRTLTEGLQRQSEQQGMFEARLRAVEAGVRVLEDRGGRQ